MSTSVFVDLEISTQTDGAQRPGVPVPFPKDPYEAIRQAYLVETETPKSPHTVASPTLVLFLCRTACMAMRVLPAISPSLSVSIAEVATMSDSAFRKRFRSSYESSPSLSPPDLPLRKHYRGTSKLVEDDEVEGEEKEDEQVEESLDSDSESEDAEDVGLAAEDVGLAAEDEGPTAGDEGLATGDEGVDLRVESLGLGGDEAILEGQQWATPIMETAVGEPLGLGYKALRHREIPFGEGRMPSVFKTPPSPEWSSGSLPISLAPSIVPSPISSPMIPLTVPSPIASPVTVEAEGFLTKLGAQVEMQGGLIHDHTVRLRELSPVLFERYDRDIRELFTRSRAVRDEIFFQRYRFRSLKHKQERVVVTFGVIWRPVLALESWACQTDAQRVALWHAISDTQMEDQEL
ncbi:hypothetical protein Tco_1395737, partial [Tanacetum coccineum]